jgi:carboxyl-terminal processing protease
VIHINPVKYNAEGDDVGYVRVTTFNEQTTANLQKAVEDLKKQLGTNLKGYIIDLRNNPGGLLDQAISVSDAFLDQGSIVLTRGRNLEETQRSNARQGDITDGKQLVVLINGGSASASEIVAGALQDHDRALVVGNNTFGKGLVQTVFPLDQTSGLALTTARYYTPSGRLIQRRYDDISLSDYYMDPCSEHYKPAHEDVRLTDRGRQVFGGGGITPDERLTEEKWNEFQMQLRRMAAFSTFAQDFTLRNPDLSPGWEPTDDDVEQFRQFLYSEKIEFKEVDFIENRDFIRRFLKREVYVAAYDLDEGLRVFYELDPEVQQALRLMPQAEALLKGGKQMLAAE